MTDSTTLVTDSEVAILNAARKTLAAIDERLRNAFVYQTAPEGVDDRDIGRVEAYGAVAADALFDFLNQADTYLRLGLDYRTMHLREPAQDGAEVEV